MNTEEMNILEEEIDSLIEMADAAETINELDEIEKLVGLADATAMNNWESLLRILYKVKSPYARFIDSLIENWERIEG